MFKLKRVFTLAYDKNVLEMSRNNVGINVGTNVGVNKTEKAVLGLLINNPEMTAEEMAIEVGVTKRTVERTLVSLKKKGLIERIGSNKNGSWAVVK